ncbi:MAG TPA: ester cyclase [Terriglobales bacterium]|jgi:steroid delta-isomerase-like uncharacterized protein
MDNAAILRRWFEEVWNKGRLSAIDEMASPDVIGHGQAQHGVDIGLKEFRPFVERLRSAFPDIRITVHQTVEQGEYAVARWSANMTHTGEFLNIRPSGRHVMVTGTTMVRIAGGKIVEGWDNWDQLGLLVQLGALPAAAFVPTAA